MAEMSTDTDCVTSPSTLSADCDGDTDVHDSEETPEEDLREVTEETPEEDLREVTEETPEEDLREVTEETPEEDLREVTEEISETSHTEGTEKTTEDTNPEESVEPHHEEKGPAVTPEVHLTSTSPGEPTGGDTAEPTEGEVKECSCNAEPDTKNMRTGESEGLLGTEEEKVAEKEEGEARLTMGATGGEEKAPEDESGEKTLVREEEGSPPATPETAEAPPGPAPDEAPEEASEEVPEEAESSEAENLHKKKLAPSESTPEEHPGSPAAAEGGSEAGVTQTDRDAPGSSGSAEPPEASEGSVETEKTPAPEKKKTVEKKRDIGRSRTVPKSHGGQSRKAIMEKFGGPATGASPSIKVQRSTSFGASSVKNMLLEWCKAKTRDYEFVDIQNFSSSWSSGMAFCALVHKFFPDEFDYATLDPKNRRQNFELAFSTAEKCADCAQLLEVDDMVRMRVPDSKCVYTYVQELYRSLVQMGLVKTKKQ